LTALAAVSFFAMMPSLCHPRLPAVLAALGALLLAVPREAHAQRRCRVAEVIVLPNDHQVRAGSTAPYAATAYDAAGNVCDVTFTWTSSNRAVATMDLNGIATGRAPGTTTITARTGAGATARSATATLSVIAGETVSVVPQQAEANRPGFRAVPGRPTGPGFAAFDYQPDGSGPAFGLLVEPPQLLLVRGETQQLLYRTAKADGTNADRQPILFSADPGGERVISVDSIGVVTARETGRTILRAAVPNHPNITPGLVAVEVRDDSVRFARLQVSLRPGARDTVPLRVAAQNRDLNPGGLFRFSSSDTTKVKVNAFFPYIQAVAPGTATVAATSPFYPSLSLAVNVHRPVAGLQLTPAGPATIAIGGQVTIGATAIAADSSAIPEAPLAWQMPDSSVVSFDLATRVLRGRRAGTTAITVRSALGHDSFTTRTLSIRVVAGGLQISRPRLGLGIGEQAAVAVELLDDRRQSVGPATDLTWSSSDDSIAVMREGQIGALRAGHARITARAPWDSTITSDVYVVDELLVTAQRGGMWNLYMMSGSSVGIQLTRDSAVEAQAALSPDLTRIAWAAAPGPRSTNFQLFVADADGGGARQLTTDSVPVSAPAWVRPAGDRIAFQAGRPGHQQLYLIGLDGTGRRALTTGESDNTAPDVSPDGAKIVFASVRETSPGQRARSDIFEMNLDGTGERQLIANPRADDSPQYSADGRSVYFLRDEGGSPPTKRVIRMDLATRVETPLTPTGSFVRSFSVSADGGRIALTTLGANNAVVMAIYDTATQALTPVAAAAGEVLASPAYRPATPQPR